MLASCVMRFIVSQISIQNRTFQNIFFASDRGQGLARLSVKSLRTHYFENSSQFFFYELLSNDLCISLSESLAFVHPQRGSVMSVTACIEVRAISRTWKLYVGLNSND